MNTQIRDLLRPEILHTVSGLELVARIVVEGFMSGSNRSQSIGAGQEFSQYRSYEPGDDLRQLDWKMYARSARYFIKQAEIETNITVKFIVDATRSMAYSENSISKLDYAKVLTAALAYLARKQSDTFGLFAVNDLEVKIVQPRFEHQQYMRFLHALIQLQGDGKFQQGHALEAVFDHHGKEMIIFFSDLYDDSDDLYRFISRLKTPRNEVIVFHIMGQEEKNLEFNGSFIFQDLESRANVRADTNLQKKHYTERLQKWLHASKTWMLEKQISYHLVLMQDRFEQVLRDFLKIRKTLVR
ncbi:MAG: DUF58 domain-containing protein [Chryseolinea sp.]